ncbi:hypothetical protein [Pseudogemmobacter sonorensis]|uniref:hypothetical protein n=1 Tax=Pseudogemmobacter sonorensis TaxID=2989681 RepID=UPI00368FC542
MVKQFLLALAAAALLGACGGNPIGGDSGTPVEPTDPVDPTDPTDPTEPTDPVELLPSDVAGHVTGAGLEGWTPGAGTLSVTMTAQDAASLTGAYVRTPARDVGEYEAYTYQSTTSNRMVVALVRKVEGVSAMIAVDAGQFANYHGGGNLWRADVFTRPTDGGQGAEYNYSGTYTGLLNAGFDTAGGPGGVLNPTESIGVTGRALVTADFTEMRISGGVDQRKVVGALIEGQDSLPDIALWATDITADGTFSDAVHRIGTSGWVAAGSYGGAFNGDGSAVAAVMVFNPTELPELYEHGMIVLPSCTSGGGPACP